MDASQLLSLKQDIAKEKEALIRGEQTEKLLLQELQDLGYASLEEAQKALRELSKESEDISVEQESVMQELEDLYEQYTSKV